MIKKVYLITFKESKKKNKMEEAHKLCLTEKKLNKKRYFKKKRCLHTILSRPITHLTIDEVVKFIKNYGGSIYEY